MFASLIIRTFSANEQYFSLTTNQSTVLSVMAYQSNEQDEDMNKSSIVEKKKQTKRERN